MTPWRTSVAILTLALGCDPTARTETRAGAPPPEDRRSREHETCSRSSDCAGDLRCMDAVCRPSVDSVLGELYAAVGDRALVAGKSRDAAEAYAAAVSHYEKEKVTPPAQLFCSQGRAVAAESAAAPQRIDLAARLFHKCLLAAPVGSTLRDRALDDLAGLVEAGLDPTVVARTDTADTYVTKTGQPAAAPAVEDLGLAVTVESKSRSGSLKKFTRFLQEKKDVRAALVPCWKANHEKTGSSSMQVAVSFKYGYDLDEYDDFKRSFVKMPDAAAGDDQGACARAALLPLAESEGRKLGEETRWEATATFTLRPPE